MYEYFALDPLLPSPHAEHTKTGSGTQRAAAPARPSQSVRGMCGRIRRVLALYGKLIDAIIIIWAIIAFPAIAQIAGRLGAQGWQEWKQMFRRLFRKRR